MFTPGNKAALGKGRPKLSLTKPELLLPALFNKGGINWAADFLRLYRNMKTRPLTPEEGNLLKFFMEFMPYLCTKVQLKEIMGSAATTPQESKTNAEQTSKLLKALEADNVTRPSST